MKPRKANAKKAQLKNVEVADRFAMKVYLEVLAACELAKVSNKKAAKFLNEKEYKTRLGAEWNHVSVKRIYERIKNMPEFREKALLEVKAKSYVKLD